MEEIHRGISKVFLKVIMMKLTGVVLTKNNQKEIKRCLLSLKFCEEIIIIDDYSTDGTLDEIQKLKQQFLDKCKIQIFQRRLNNFSEQRNFGMEKASGEWILFVDSDETVSQDLASEITKLLNGSMVNGYQAFYLKRRDYFWGKELKYGETQKIRKVGIIRLVKKDSGKWEGKVHEEYRVYKVRSYKVHKVESLNGYIEHYPHQTVKEFIESVNFYSSIRADELHKQGKKTTIFEIITFPLFKFIFSYFLKFGFLDGPAGFVYSFFMSFHSFLVRIKLYQKYVL